MDLLICKAVEDATNDENETITVYEPFEVQYDEPSGKEKPVQFFANSDNQRTFYVLIRGASDGQTLRLYHLDGFLKKVV